MSEESGKQHSVDIAQADIMCAAQCNTIRCLNSAGRMEVKGKEGRESHF